MSLFFNVHPACPPRRIPDMHPQSDSRHPTQTVRLRFAVAVVFLLGFAFSAPLHAVSARHYLKQGRRDEAKDDYIGAYEAYHQAYLLKPSDLRYKEASIRLSFPAAAEYVDRGRKLMDQGRLSDALTDFLRALAIDPSDEVADQNIRKVRALINGVPIAANSSASAISAKQVQTELASMGSPLDLKPFSNEPITLHMVADTKVIYQTIGKIAGINVLFDPDYVSKRMPIDLNRVTLYDALRSVSFVSKTFWRPVTADTIFVAQDTRQKRTDLSQQAVQTFYLSNISKANDLNEILNAIRNLMDTTVKLQAVPSQDAIVMRGTPDQLLLAQNIIDDLDKGKQEVVVDVAVMEVSRDLLRNIGIQFPGSIGATFQPTSQILNQINQGSMGGLGGLGGLGALGGLGGLGGFGSMGGGIGGFGGMGSSTISPTLNDFGNLNATNFAISLGSATVNLLLTDTSTRILQNPSMRVVDGEKASLKIGERIPIATGSMGTGMMGGGGMGGLGGGISPLMSTQFQYIDVGVNIQMQPTVHYDRDITLKMKIEISSETGNVNLGGIEEPIIGQRTIEQTIRMKEGEPNLLGGILEHSETITIGGTPGLGEIPLIKYLFSSQQKEVVNDEIVFLLIPHLVRGSVLTRQNLRTIDTGTSSDVQLRRIEAPEAISEIKAQAQPEPPPAAPLSAAVAINQAAAQFAKNAQTVGMPVAPPAAPPVAPPAATPAVVQATAPTASAQKTGNASTTPAAAQATPQKTQTPSAPGSAPATAAPATSPANAQKAGSASAPSTGAPTNPPASAPLPGTPLQLTVQPAASTQKIGSTFQMSVNLQDAKDIFEVPMELHFDPNLLTLINVDTGTLLSKDGQTVALAHRDDGKGNVTISASRPPGVKGVDGSGSICTLTFQAKAHGDATVSLVQAAARNSGQHILPVISTAAVVHVQ